MKNIIKSTIIALGLLLAVCCSPDDYTYHDINIVDITEIDSVALVANQVFLLADGQAQLELYPKLFNKEKKQILDYRVNDEWLEYTSAAGASLSRYFSTSDASLIGKTLTTQLKIKGTNLISNPVSFQVVAPLEQKYTSEIKIPVVFHIIQTTEDINSYGGEYDSDRIGLLLTKLNHMLDGTASVNPIGVNTHIRLVSALFNQDGRKLPEPGINRLTVKEINNTNNYEDFLQAQRMIWPADKYLNIWLISDREKKTENFANTVSSLCYPHYVYPGTSDLAEGIEWTEVTENTTFLAKESGIIYRLQELGVVNRTFLNSKNKPANNDLGFYVGLYLGLLPTCNYGTEAGTDYCADTHNYFPDTKAFKENQTWYKEANGCYFRSENMMDDPTGGHCSVSKDQCVRIRWILSNCPERAAWKSDFAFTGK